VTEENRRENVRSSVQRGEQELTLAKNALRDGFPHAVISHAYFACFHHAMALLFSEGLQAKSHSGVAHLVNIHFVRTGRLSPRLLQLLSHQQKDRETADYDVLVPFTEDMAHEAIEDARRFALACRALLQGIV